MAGAKGSPIGSQNRFNKDIFESLENTIQDVIRAKSESRMAFPVDTAGMNLDITSRFWEKLNEAVGVGYNFQIVNVPEVDFETSPQRDDIPAMASAMGFPFDEWNKLSKATLSLNDRIQKFGLGWAINEDIRAWIGEAAIGVSNIMDTTNNSTALSGTTNVTSIANIHATIAGALNQLDDALEFNASNSNIKMIVNRDVAKKMKTVIDATGDGVTNGWRYAKETLADLAGDGSEIIVSKYMDGSVAYAGRRVPTVTAGAGGMAFYPFDPTIAKIVASPTIRNDDPLTVKAGKYIRWAQRWRWLSRRKEGILTVAAATIS